MYMCIDTYTYTHIWNLGKMTKNKTNKKVSF